MTAPEVAPTPIRSAPSGRERNKRYNAKHIKGHEAVFVTLTGSSALAVKVNAPLFDREGKAIGCTCTDADCPPKNWGKHPVGDKWNEHGTRDWDIAARWLGEGYNLGYLAPAEVPEGVAPIIGIDVDDPTVVATYFPDGVPDTVSDTVDGSGRCHLWFRLAPGTDPLTIPAVFDGGEIARGGSRMLTAPLALHPDGPRHWNGATDVLRLPQSALDALQTSRTAQKQDWAEAKPGEAGWKVTAGHRHAFLLNKAGSLRNAGMRGDALLAALRSFNQERCDPPKPDEEVQQIARDYDRREGNDEAPIHLDVPREGRDTNRRTIDDDSLVVASRAKPVPNYGADFPVPFLLVPNGLTILASTEGLGKTRVRTELAIRLAVGQGMFLGRYPITRETKVLVFDEDQGPERETQVEEEVLAALGLDRAALGEKLLRYSLLGIDLTNEDDQRLVEQRVEKLVPGVLILDTASAMVGEEWGASLKAVSTFLIGLASRQQCAVLAIVHLTKPMRDPRNQNAGQRRRTLDEVMGHWTKFATAVWVMSGMSGDDRALFETHKRIPHSMLVLAQRNGLWEVVADQTGKPPVGATIVLEAGSSDDRILRAIHDRVDLTRENTGVRDSARHDAIKRLRAKGLLGPEYPYELTPAGRDAIGVDNSDPGSDSGVTPVSTPVSPALSTQDSGQ